MNLLHGEATSIAFLLMCGAMIAIGTLVLWEDFILPIFKKEENLKKD